VPDLGPLLREIIEHPEVQALVRILLAGGLAALIGLEREIEGKPAGVRTYGLVGMGAAIFTIAGVLVFGPDAGSRVASGIVTGIGFIGAGTILHMTRRVVGLTTAAGLWVAAAVGMAVGGGLYVLGIGAAVAMFVLLQFLRPEVLVRFGLASEEDVEGRVPESKGAGGGSGGAKPR
jgi:putative Mg2+ transporter-C (MgtC) family protein